MNEHCQEEIIVPLLRTVPKGGVGLLRVFPGYWFTEQFMVNCYFFVACDPVNFPQGSILVPLKLKCFVSVSPPPQC